MIKNTWVKGSLNVSFDLNVCPFVAPVGIHQGESTIIAGNQIIQNVADILQKIGVHSKAFVDTTGVSTTDHIPPKCSHDPRPQDHYSYTLSKPKLISARVCTPCSQHNNNDFSINIH